MSTLLEIITDNIARVRSTNAATEPVSRTTGQVLELRIPAAWPGEDELDWCLRHGAEILAHGRARTLADLPAEARQAQLRTWIPAADTLLTTATLPTRSQRKIDQALPYTLEDKLLGDPGELFFAHTLNADKSLAVAAISRIKITSWLTELAASGFHPAVLAPLTLSVPLLENSWNMTFWGNEAWVRTGTCSGFACPTNSEIPPLILLTALAGARDSGQAPESLLVCNPPAGFDAESWANELGLEIPVDDVEPWENISPGIVPINLLQREFSPKIEKHGIFNQLVPAAVMLAIWFIGTMTIGGWQWWSLSNDYQHARQEMISILRASFPEQSKVIVDPYRQMRRNLELLGNNSSGASDNSYLNLLAKAAPVLSHQAASSLLGYEYRNKSLAIDVLLTDYRSMEALKKSLRSRKLDIEVKKASSHAGGVSARILLRSANAGGAS